MAHRPGYNQAEIQPGATKGPRKDHKLGRDRTEGTLATQACKLLEQEVLGSTHPGLIGRASPPRRNVGAHYMSQGMSGEKLARGQRAGPTGKQGPQGTGKR